MKSIIKRLAHAQKRISLVRNWWLLFPPFNRLTDEAVIKMRDGAKMYVRDIYAKDSTTDLSLVLEIWDGTSKNYPKLSSSDVIFDLGAHIGASSVYLARHTGATVYAFEPDGENFSLLWENITLNNLEGRVIPLELAIWKEDGRVRLNTHTKNKGGHSIAKSFETGSKYSVETRTLETFISQYNIDRIAFLKCDVEGAEFEIFKNTPKHIFDRIEGGLVEMHGKDFSKHQELQAHLESMGFKTALHGKPKRGTLQELRFFR